MKHINDENNNPPKKITIIVRTPNTNGTKLFILSLLYYFLRLKKNDLLFLACLKKNDLFSILVTF